jgi:hypothetical protein
MLRTILLTASLETLRNWAGPFLMTSASILARLCLREEDVGAALA